MTVVGHDHNFMQKKPFLIAVTERGLQEKFANTRASENRPAIMADTGDEEDAIHYRG